MDTGTAGGAIDIVESGKARDAADRAIIDALPLPAALLDARRELRHANAGAHRLARDPGVLVVSQGRASSLAGSSARQFDAAFERALAGRPASISAAAIVAGQRAVWHVYFGPLRLPARPPSDHRTNCGATAARVLLLMSSAAPAASQVAALAGLFGLTTAESRVLHRLLHDRPPAGIAADLGLAVSTVRTHLSALYQKSGTRGQSELVRLAGAAGSAWFAQVGGATQADDGPWTACCAPLA